MGSRGREPASCGGGRGSAGEARNSACSGSRRSGGVVHRSLVDVPANPKGVCAQTGLKRVEPGDPSKSLLYLKLQTAGAPCGQQMPQRRGAAARVAAGHRAMDRGKRKVEARSTHMRALQRISLARLHANNAKADTLLNDKPPRDTAADTSPGVARWRPQSAPFRRHRNGYENSVCKPA